MFFNLQKSFKNIKNDYIKKIILGGFFFFLIKGLLWIVFLVIAWFSFS
jgi:hypothetical protein